MTKQEYETKIAKAVSDGNACGVCLTSIAKKLNDIKTEYIKSLETEIARLNRVNANSVSKMELDVCRSLNEALRQREVRLKQPILCHKCNDHILSNDGAICEVCASTQESVISELQSENETLRSDNQHLVSQVNEVGKKLEELNDKLKCYIAIA